MSMDFIEESLSRKRDIPFFLFCAGGGRMGTKAADDLSPEELDALLKGSRP